jgi:hypothetical protein
MMDIKVVFHNEGPGRSVESKQEVAYELFLHCGRKGTVRPFLTALFCLFLEQR